MLGSINHLTFDCYGTLIDWRQGIETHLGGMLRSKGVSRKVFPEYVRLEAEEEGSYKSYVDVLGRTAIKVARNFGLELTHDEADKFAQSVPLWKPFDDTVEALQKLGTLGLKRIILSNIDTNLLRETISKNNLKVDGYITAEEIGSYKPAIGHWKSFLERYGVAKENVLHVAQSIFHDIVPAHELGLKTAWINRYDETEPRQVNPDYTFSKLAEVASLFDPVKS